MAGEYRESCLALQAESELDGHLPIGNGAVFEVAPDFFDLKPVHVAQGLGGLSEAVADGIIDAFSGCSDNFRNAIGVVRQRSSS